MKKTLEYKIIVGMITLALPAGAATIHLSAGEAATRIGTMQGDGAGIETISGVVWNNIAEINTGPNTPQAILGSSGAATLITAYTISPGSFSDSRGDLTTGGGEDTNDSLVSRFGQGGVLGQAAANVNPLLVIGGFLANQQLGGLSFYHLVDDANPRGTMDVTVNGVSQSLGAFVTSGTVSTFPDVVADSNGDVIVTSTNYISAVSLDYTAIPEPSSIFLLGLGGIASLFRRRRC